MAEADTQDQTETEETTEAVNDEPEWTPEIEEIALSFGWKPREQFDPAKGEWKDPKTFIANTRKVVFDSRDKIRNYEGKLNRIVAQVAKLQGNQRSQADADAQAALAAAVEAGDVEGAQNVLKQVRASQAPDENPALTAFKERNEWFGTDDEATAYAAALDRQYAKDGIADPDAHMRKVEAGVKKRFPELFGGDTKTAADPKARSAPLVARGGGPAERSRNGGELTVATMTPEMRRAAEAVGVKPESYVKSFNEMAKADTRRRFS
jgi:hypothetical protein